MEQNKYAKTGWTRKKGNTFDFELPSGQLVQLKKLDMKAIVKAGLVARLDTFTGQLLPDGTKSVAQNSSNVMLEMLKDEKKFEEFEEVVDKVVMVTVLQPRVYPALPEDYERDEQRVYLDDIDIEDKLAIFGAVFVGVGDMSQFREGQGGGVEPVEEKPAAADPAESDDRVPAGDS